MTCSSMVKTSPNIIFYYILGIDYIFNLYFYLLSLQYMYFILKLFPFDLVEKLIYVTNKLNRIRITILKIDHRKLIFLSKQEINI